ncbi:hypothetical protein [Lysinibacillus odysseyi]|uniref:Uncharacterized protein n=1 Tax=Lysinibacillus odysseyi 34hs-1 = NBRC 100172 TaxID=1220589 RepID=A0A0A3II67_9BACI|nr:hypothetical protein [Lysinibacillus odysseyi]KGR84466.1 hypothetical protein CD32_12845 [Lysinibacillus odysseyi 34hs-1 = NBRC 100172]
MAVYKMSCMCAAFNIIVLISYFALIVIEAGVLAGIVLLGIIFFPLVTFAGIMLGIGALVLKEPRMKSLIAVAVNSVYPVGSFYLFKLF